MVRRTAVLGAALASLLAFVAPAARADTVAAPLLYMRLDDPDNQSVGITPWQPLGPNTTINSLGPYEIGVAVQAQPSAKVLNRQGIEVDLASDPGGAPPSGWAQLAPYTPFCHSVAGAVGTVGSTGIRLYFHGDGAYKLNVSAYTDAQQSSFPGSTCSGGPTSAVTMNVAATTTASIVGAPLVPRGSVRAKGFTGLQFTAPNGTIGFRYRCALDPVLSADGSISGTKVKSGQSLGLLPPATQEISETDAFSGPGRWACSVQLLGGDEETAQFPTPWATSQTVTVRGQYVRDPRRTYLRREPHHRERLTVNTLRSLAAPSAGGRLTLKLSFARCEGGHRFSLHTVQTVHAKVGKTGQAAFDVHTPRAQGFYLGQLFFGGTTLVIPTQDAALLMQVGVTSQSPLVTFVDPVLWDPCHG
jgi:hypothetical protein